ncbi:hypothetical protein DD238_007266 [Peronospora effusa]|uniref:Uncharacterized protein n=1 Tax=Peronospora effusa TaxID=542832 RepID=A0A3M6VC10_9STRA|nr:hypothetical protein DD238_007266 [Peronospora effusa]RQM10171.1 hypothetical protein DD237_004341 [Peronospora effusa]
MYSQASCVKTCTTAFESATNLPHTVFSLPHTVFSLPRTVFSTQYWQMMYVCTVPLASKTLAMSFRQ